MATSTTVYSSKAGKAARSELYGELFVYLVCGINITHVCTESTMLSSQERNDLQLLESPIELVDNNLLSKGDFYVFRY